LTDVRQVHIDGAAARTKAISELDMLREEMKAGVKSLGVVGQ
jgi:hypothetical protein